VQAWPACLFAFAIYQEVRSNTFYVFGFDLTMWMLQELCCAGVCVCHCFAGLTSFALGKELFASWSLVWRVGDFQLMVLML
jgi:hypothetical protein